MYIMIDQYLIYTIIQCNSERQRENRVARQREIMHERHSHIVRSRERVARQRQGRREIVRNEKGSGVGEKRERE